MSATALQIDYVDPNSAHEFHLPISVFKRPANSKEYAKLEKILDQLIDEVRGNEKHPLAIAPYTYQVQATLFSSATGVAELASANLDAKDIPVMQRK